MSTAENGIPYDGMALFCGDGAQAMGFVYYLKEQGRKKTDLLTMPGGSRSLSLHEQEGHELPSENKERLIIMKKAIEIALATYLNHGGDEIDICDHFKCGFWFDYTDYQEAKVAQIASMFKAASVIMSFIKKLKEDVSFANKMKVDPKKIKVKKFNLYYANLNNEGDLENIEKVGELPI